MAIVIHHGAPGSYKSFCLVQEVAIPALLEGRTVVTNIRSFTIDKVRQYYPELTIPQEASVYHIDCDSSARNRLILSSFFHWLPFKACLIIDEGQRIYPNRRDFKLESLDTFICPDSFDFEYNFKTTDSETGLPVTYSRPEDVKIAFDMHRHYQWDIYISTPNISKIHKDIRESTEYAYYHKSLAGKIPFLFKNQWYEFQHDPENNGKSKSHIIGSPTRKIANLKAFQCYSSTITGDHTESKAGKPIFSDRSVRIKIYTILLTLSITGSFFVYRLLSADNSKTADINTEISTKILTKNIQPINKVALNTLVSPASNAPSNNLLNKATPSSIGFLNSIETFYDNDFHKINFLTIKDNQLITITSDQILKSGYRIKLLKHCFVSLELPDGSIIDLTCDLIQPVICSTKVKTDEIYLNRGCSLSNVEKTNDDNPSKTTF
jgi:zona occludens toxin